LNNIILRPNSKISDDFHSVNEFTQKGLGAPLPYCIPNPKFWLE